MKIYHTETREDYDALMVELEGKGFKWAGGSEMLQFDIWNSSENLTSIRVYGSEVNHASLNYYKEEYPHIPIIKYKAKVDERMRFTKENVEKVIDEYFQEADFEPCGDLIAEIHNLDDTPEKVVVPKFVADFYEECENATLEFLIAQLEAYDSRSVLGEWYRSCSGRHRNSRANTQEIIARMKLNGYTIEPEQLYYIPLPHLETSDGIQQVLSKRENGENYFAWRPTESVQQRYTKAELERVPEVYKQFAKPIEEEEE